MRLGGSHEFGAMLYMMSYVVCTVTEWSMIETVLSNVCHHNPQVAGGGLHRAGRAGEAQDRAGQWLKNCIISSKNFFFYFLPPLFLSPLLSLSTD